MRKAVSRLYQSFGSYSPSYSHEQSMLELAGPP
jgi:hypothetical protein